jgi:hypothetical protein
MPALSAQGTLRVVAYASAGRASPVPATNMPEEYDHVRIRTLHQSHSMPRSARCGVMQLSTRIQALCASAPRLQVWRVVLLAWLLLATPATVIEAPHL